MCAILESIDCHQGLYSTLICGCDAHPNRVGASKLGESSTAELFGRRISLHGLTGSAALNGQHGRCDALEGGRYTVTLDSGQTMRVKLANLRLEQLAGPSEHEILLPPAPEAPKHGAARILGRLLAILAILFILVI